MGARTILPTEVQRAVLTSLSAPGAYISWTGNLVVKGKTELRPRQKTRTALEERGWIGREPVRPNAHLQVWTITESGRQVANG